MKFEGGIQESLGGWLAWVKKNVVQILPQVWTEGTETWPTLRADVPKTCFCTPGSQSSGFYALEHSMCGGRYLIIFSDSSVFIMSASFNLVCRCTSYKLYMLQCSFLMCIFLGSSTFRWYPHFPPCDLGLHLMTQDDPTRNMMFHLVSKKNRKNVWLWIHAVCTW